MPFGRKINYEMDIKNGIYILMNLKKLIEGEYFRFLSKSAYVLGECFKLKNKSKSQPQISFLPYKLYLHENQLIN